LMPSPYSLSGQPENKADYGQSRFGFTVGGPLNIPHIYHGRNQDFSFRQLQRKPRHQRLRRLFPRCPTQAERFRRFLIPAELAEARAALRPHYTGGSSRQSSHHHQSCRGAIALFLPLAECKWRGGRTSIFVLCCIQQFGTQHLSASTIALVQIRQGPARSARRRSPPTNVNNSKDKNQKTEKTHWSQSINGGFVFNDLRRTVLNPFPRVGRQANGPQLQHQFRLLGGQRACS